MLGTTLALKGVTETLLHDPTGAVYSHRAPHGDLWLPGGASGTGAGVITTLFRGQDLDVLTEHARQLRDVPLCYPLADHGERFPFVATRCAGVPRRRSAARRPGGRRRPARVFAAVCIGVAQVERLCFDLLDQRRRRRQRAGQLHRRGLAQLLVEPAALRPARRAGAHPRSAEAALGMAVLAAGAVEGDVLAAARRLVQLARGAPARPRIAAAALAAGYADFVDALAGRGWLDARTAAHAREQVAA